jgi:hypothetical protein
MEVNGDGVAVPEDKANNVEPTKDRTKRPQRAPGPEILVKRANEMNRVRRIKAKQHKQEVAARLACDRSFYTAVPYDYGDQGQGYQEDQVQNIMSANTPREKMQNDIYAAATAPKVKMQNIEHAATIPKVNIKTVKYSDVHSDVKYIVEYSE